MNDYYDSRQHLNLSRHAYDVIENDKFEFLEKPSRQRVINMILAAYVDDADAAIDNALIRRATPGSVIYDRKYSGKRSAATRLG